MNILHASPRYLPAIGGAEKHLHEFSRRLVAEGHRVQVVTTNALDADSFWNPTRRHIASRQDVIDGVEVLRLPLHYFPVSTLAYRGIRRGLSILSEVGAPLTLLNRIASNAPNIPDLERTLQTDASAYDLIAGMNIAYESALIPAWALAERDRRPWVIFPLTHLGDSADEARIRKFYTMRHQLALVRAAAAVFTQTRSESQFFCKVGIDPKRLIRLGPGVNPDELRGGNAARARARWKLPGPVVLFIGALSADKGALALLQAMGRLWTQGDRASTLVMVGAEPDEWRDAFSKEPREIQARVRMPGVISDADKNDLLAACNVLVLPSRVDSFGIVLLEAWLYDKPVIGAAAGGLPDVIAGEQDGLLTPFGDAPALAKAIQRLLQDPATAAQMGRKGCNKVLA
ncbi:MAG: glycosyltransferase family 4 protein, partial [Anaerolineae bacterium]